MMPATYSVQLFSIISLILPINDIWYLVSVSHILLLFLYLILQPFGQVPVFQDGDLILYGEIVTNNARFLLGMIQYY